jgi:anaerobic selenocysteine-containing dehydrogenase
MAKRVSRRDFLKVTSAVVAAASAGSGVSSFAQATASPRIRCE